MSALKTVAFIGSPRKGGNTDRLVDEILAGATNAGHETEKVYLVDFGLTPIDPVYGEELNWTDSRQGPADELIDKMVAADVVVLGSPVYWFNISGSMKLFIDRWALYQRGGQRLRDLTVGKRMVVALAMADATDEYVDAVLAPLRYAAKWLKMQWAGQVIACAVGDPGDIEDYPQVLAQARELGQSL